MNALTRLTRIKEKYPDLRIGQIIMNALDPLKPVDYLFYLTDSDLEDGLRMFEGICKVAYTKGTKNGRPDQSTSDTPKVS
jgi:hypothetical protein